MNIWHCWTCIFFIPESQPGQNKWARFVRLCCGHEETFFLLFTQKPSTSLVCRSQFGLWQAIRSRNRPAHLCGWSRDKWRKISLWQAPLPQAEKKVSTNSLGQKRGKYKICHCKIKLPTNTWSHIHQKQAEKSTTTIWCILNILLWAWWQWIKGDKQRVSS